MKTLKAAPPYGTIVFDCDSTLSSIEGIEDLAIGCEHEVRALTERAMNGELPLEAVYGARLEAIRPTRDMVERIGARYIETALPNVAELVSALRFLDKRVCVVSGGLLQPVARFARAIGVDEREVDAVAVLFDAAGEYAGFDVDSPLARAGGKHAVLSSIASGPDARPPLALVGDGATDLEAASLCARFIGFGGVERREHVLSAADATCLEPDFAALLFLLCSEREIAHLADQPAHHELVRAARSFSS